MNILYYDLEKFDVDEVRAIYEKVKEVLDDDHLLALPYGINLVTDMNQEALVRIENLIKEALSEKKKKNMFEDTGESVFNWY